MKDKRLIGIDFGTTNSCVCYTAYNRQAGAYDEPQAIEFDGQPLLRSVLLLDEQGQEALAWGEAAYDSPAFVSRPGGLQEEFKLQVGTDPQAEHLITLLFRPVLDTLTRWLNTPRLDPQREHVVVGVPAQWTLDQQEATRLAIEEAGFPPVETMAEPLGALLYHYFLGDVQYREGEDCTLVIDFGGGTTDFVVVTRGNGGQLPEIAHTYGERYGGTDFDRAIMNRILERSWQRGEPTVPQRAEMLRFARRFKEHFSNRVARGEEAAQFYCSMPGVDSVVSLTLRDFEGDELCAPLIQRFAGIVLKGVQGSQRTVHDVDRVILTGGSARWYFARQAVQSMFRCPILLSANPEQTIAKGLALAKAEFRPRPQPSTALEIVPAPGEVVEVPALPATARVLSDEDLERCRGQARKVIPKYVGMAGGTAIVLSPIVGSSLALSGLETKMVMDISRVYGYNLSAAEVGAIIGGILATGAVLKATVQELLTFLPGIGWAAKGAVAAVAITALGEAAIRFFEECQKGTIESPFGLEGDESGFSTEIAGP